MQGATGCHDVFVVAQCFRVVRLSNWERLRGHAGDGRKPQAVEFGRLSDNTSLPRRVVASCPCTLSMVWARLRVRPT